MRSVAQVNLKLADGTTYSGAGDSIAEAAAELERAVDAAPRPAMGPACAVCGRMVEPLFPDVPRPVCARCRAAAAAPKSATYLERYRRLALRERGEGRP
jgi:hypothetical protein